MNNDRPLLGILLMLGFCVLAPLGDGIAKLLGEKMQVVQLVTIRFSVQALLLVPLIWWTGGRFWIARHLYGLTFLRTLLHILGIGAMFLSLRYLPIADAVAIAFVMPFIMLLLGKVFLNEDVGPHRLFACVVGFVGTLLVIQPNFVDVGMAALLPLLVAVVFALFMLVTRKIAKQCDPIALQAVSGMMACVVLVPTWLGGNTLGWLGFQAAAPSGFDVVLLLMLGTLGTCAHLLMTWSLRFAPSATLAPMQYLEIPFATVVGWFLFRDLPNGLASVGIMITIGAGLYVIFREQWIARQNHPAL